MQQQRSVQTKDKDQISGKTNGSSLVVSPQGGAGLQEKLWEYLSQVHQKSDITSLSVLRWVIINTTNDFFFPISEYRSQAHSFGYPAPYVDFMDEGLDHQQLNQGWSQYAIDRNIFIAFGI